MTLFKRKVSLPMQVLIALVLGVVIGLLLFGQTGVANYIKPFGDVFLNLIKMIIIPIVFCSLALSISNLGIRKIEAMDGNQFFISKLLQPSPSV